MTADISSSVADKALCWCEGRKTRIMRPEKAISRRLTYLNPELVLASRSVPALTWVNIQFDNPERASSRSFCAFSPLISVSPLVSKVFP
jgi:hypothetical protein